MLTVSATFIPLITAALLATVAHASAVEYPVLHQGLWHFHRTVTDPAHPDDSKVLEIDKCVDPVTDMKTMNERLTKAGCRFSPAEREGDVYRFTATCALPGGAEAVSVTELTYHSADAYEARRTGARDSIRRCSPRPPPLAPVPHRYAAGSSTPTR